MADDRDLSERNLRLVLMKAVADAISERIAEFRQEHQEILMEIYSETLDKAFPVEIDGVKVATISLTGSAGGVEVTDETAFLAWAELNRPGSVEEVVTPPQPERRERRIKPKLRTAYLAGLVAGPGEMAVDPVTEQIVDGVAFREPGKPKSFQVRFTPGTGRERVIEAWQAGQLNIAGAEPLPQIESAR